MEPESPSPYPQVPATCPYPEPRGDTTKLIMEWIPGERRKRGRPRKTWMEGVRAAMKTRHLEADQWLNRKEWCLGPGRRRQLSQDRKDR